MLKLRALKRHQPNISRQGGMTLMELLVAGVISIIASLGMVMVMANSLGTGSQTIKMTRLTQDMRTAMQIMSRELRRANYHSDYMACYGNVDCLGAGSLNIAAKVSEIHISDNGNSDCFWFWYDRPQTGTQVAVNAEPVAAFRRTIASGTIGKLQMTTTRTTTPGCDANTDWVDITNPDLVDILTFNVSDANSFTQAINAGGDTQSVERIALSMTARLAVDASVPTWLQNNANASRELTEFVTVRNNTTAKYVAASP